MKKPGLLVRIVIAIILGIALGLFLPEAVVRVFVTFNGLFGNFLSFIIPLIMAISFGRAAACARRRLATARFQARGDQGESRPS